MARQKLPNFHFEKGLLIEGDCPSFYSPRLETRLDWSIIGRLENGTPFFFAYTSIGGTTWWCEENLGQSLRKKILDRFRVDARHADSIPAWIAVHKHEPVTSMSDRSMFAEPLFTTFFNDIWRAEYLGDRDDDYVALVVPFAEKDEAKALGAAWQPEKKVWQVKKRDDMTPFQKWLPKEFFTEAAAK